MVRPARDRPCARDPSRASPAQPTRSWATALSVRSLRRTVAPLRRPRAGTPNPHISAASAVLFMAPSIAAKTMRYVSLIGLITLSFSTWGGSAAHAELGTAAGPRIQWEVKNRFRLFRNEADFQRHVAAHRGEGVLAAERRLARDSDGRGCAWTAPASSSNSAIATANARPTLLRATTASA